MLKLQTINRFSSPVNSVAKDFVRRIHEIKDSENEVAGIETEVFKWALECKKANEYIT